MKSEFFNYKDMNGVIEVTLNRPKLHNAFNEDFISDLTNGFEEIAANENARVVVLSGEGKSFCAGADLNWMKKMKEYSSEENYNDSVALAELFRSINSCPIPVVGKVHGAALGGGVGLVSVCDFVIAEKETVFGFTETRLGLIPAVISPFVVAKIGETNARAYFISGSRFGTHEAFHMGLVHKVSTDLENDTKKQIEEYLKAGPEASRRAKKLLWGLKDLNEDGPEMIQDFTCKMIASTRITDEAQEGMDALLNKRKPNWIE